MTAHGYAEVMPRWDAGELPDNPFIDLSSNYVLRSVHEFPKQGHREPWRLYQNYIRDVILLKRGRVDDPALEFSKAS